MRSSRSLLYFPFLGERSIGRTDTGYLQKIQNYSESQIELGQTIANQLSVAYLELSTS